MTFPKFQEGRKRQEDLEQIRLKLLEHIQQSEENIATAIKKWEKLVEEKKLQRLKEEYKRKFGELPAEKQEKVEDVIDIKPTTNAIDKPTAAESNKEEQEPDAEAVYNFDAAYLPEETKAVDKKITNLLAKKKENEKAFVNETTAYLTSLANARKTALERLQQSIDGIQSAATREFVQTLVGSADLMGNMPKSKEIYAGRQKRSKSPDAWNAYAHCYTTLIKEAILINALKQTLNFDFANLPADYNLSEIKPFLELFRADNLTAENTELTEEERLEIKSFTLFKQRALELLKKELGIHLPAFDKTDINTEMDAIREKYIRNIENLKYSSENKQILMERMGEYFNELIGKADSLVKTELGEIKMQNTEEMVEFLRRPENTPYRESHNFQIKADPEESKESVILPVNPTDYFEEKLAVLAIDEKLPNDALEPPDAKTAGTWLVHDPQFGYEIQDEWRRYGSPAGIEYEQFEDGEREIKKVYFHTAEEKEYFLEQLRGRQESPEGRQIYRKKIFDYLKGDDDEAQNDEAQKNEAQKEMRRLIKEFGRSRGWNKEHLARAYSKELGIDPALTGEEFMDGFIKRKGYVYYSEKVIKEKTGDLYADNDGVEKRKNGLSLEGVLLRDSLADLDIADEQKKALANYFSRNNHLEEPKQGIENFKTIEKSWKQATDNLDQGQLKDILASFRDVREAMVDIGLVMKSFDAQGRVGYQMTNKEDVVLIPYQDGEGNYTAIRRRLLKNKLSYNYYDKEERCWKKYTEEINGGLEPGGNKYLSDPRVYSDFEPRQLEGTTYNAALLIPKIWKSEADWIAAGGLKEQWNPNEAKAIIAGQNIVITEGEFKSVITSELTGIPHIAIPGITMVEPELIQKIKEAGPKSVIIVFDADPDGMAHLRGDLLTDSERAGYRIAKMLEAADIAVLEAADIAVKVAIWPEEYRQRRIKTEIKDIEDLLVRQTDGIKIYQDEILAKAVSCEEYASYVNQNARQEDLRYAKMEKLNPTMEQVLALEHDLRIALEKFKTAQARGAAVAPKELINKIEELENIAGLMWTLKKETSHFYLGADLDKPAEHVMSLSPDIVPESEDKSFITEKGERIPADKAEGNIINYRFFPADILEIEEKLILQKREQFYFIDPVDEKQTIVSATWAELNKALDFESELGENDQDKKYRQIRADALNGLSAVDGLDWEKVITGEKAQSFWQQKCLEHDISEADLLLTVYSADFDKQAQRITGECFANKEEKNQLTNIIRELDDYLADKLSQKEFAEKTALYVIGNYLIDKFPADDVRYELGVLMLENESGVLVNRGRINISGWDAKKASGILKFTASILAVEPSGQERTADYQTAFSKVQIEFRNLINTLRGSYAEQRREFRGALEWCKSFAEKNQEVIFAGETLNRKDYLKELIQSAFNIAPEQVNAVVDDLGLMVLFPDDFNKMLASGSQELFDEAEEKPTKTSAAKSGVFALRQDGKPSPKFLGPILMIGKSPSFDQEGKKAADVGADILPLFYETADRNELARNPALSLEAADRRPVFPLQGQGNESRRASKAYFEGQHHLSHLEGEGAVVVCFGLPELVREQAEQFRQNIKPEKQAVIGIDYSLELLLANMKKVLNKHPKEIKIVIDNLAFASVRSVLNQDDKPELGILRELSILTEIKELKGVELKLKVGDQEKLLSDWLKDESLAKPDRIDISTEAGRIKVKNIRILKEYLMQFTAWLNLPVKPPECLKDKDVSKIKQNTLAQDAEYKELPSDQRKQIDKLITWAQSIPGLAQDITGIAPDIAKGIDEPYKQFIAKLLNREPSQIVSLGTLAQEKFTANNYSLLSLDAKKALNKIPGIISEEDSDAVRTNTDWNKRKREDLNIINRLVKPRFAAEKISETLGCA